MKGAFQRSSHTPLGVIRSALGGYATRLRYVAAGLLVLIAVIGIRDLTFTPAEETPLAATELSKDHVGGNNTVLRITPDDNLEVLQSRILIVDGTTERRGFMVVLPAIAKQAAAVTDAAQPQPIQPPAIESPPTESPTTQYQPIEYNVIGGTIVSTADEQAVVSTPTVEISTENPSAPLLKVLFGAAPLPAGSHRVTVHFTASGLVESYDEGQRFKFEWPIVNRTAVVNNEVAASVVLPARIDPAGVSIRYNLGNTPNDWRELTFVPEATKVNADGVSAELLTNNDGERWYNVRLANPLPAGRGFVISANWKRGKVLPKVEP